MAEHRPLNVLSLDGGGVRGLSSLLILRLLMRQLRVKSGLKTDPLPCQVFDIICGNSTGGLIAIMLGRLRMSVEDAIVHYRLFSKEAFRTRSFAFLRKIYGSAVYDASTLEKNIREIVAKFDAQDHNEDAPLKDPLAENPKGLGGCCYTFVVAIPQLGADAPPVLFRSYPADSDTVGNCKIWEAVRATTATTNFFQPAIIGTPPRKFLDGEFSANNPSALACDEVRDAFPGRRIGCFLSLGTGVPKVVQMKGSIITIAQACHKLATDCEKIANQVGERFRLESSDNGQPNPFIRFSVNRGLEDVGLDEWNQEERLTSITEGYMRYDVQEAEAEKCIGMLKARGDELGLL